MIRLTTKNRPVRQVPASGAAASPAANDEACLDAFERELDYIHATLRRLGVAAADIEDLAQEVFVVLRGVWARCDHTRPLRPYIFGIAFRLSAAHRRKRSREVPFGGIDDAEDASADLDEAMQTKQARKLILDALDRVPLPRRAVLVMHDLDELSIADIASVLGIRVFTAYARLRKARRELASGLRRALTRTSGEVAAHTLPIRARVSGQA